MSSCLGCSCSRPSGAELLRPGACGAVLLSTRVSHTLAAIRSAVSDAGLRATGLAPGLLRVQTPEPGLLLSAVRAALSSVEAGEVRVAVLSDESGDALLAAALGASTLAQVSARVRHADLLPLFADERGSFRSVYQPIVSLTSPAPVVVGHEALLRATGPSGPLTPYEMFSAAAESGWLHLLDRVGRTTALRGAKGWLGDDLLFVNFLPTTIYRPQVCLATTERAAAEAGLRLDQLVFEVTESERVTDLDHLADVFAYYRERGCRVALDDLGAGYSSLNMLVRLQPDVVKLDKDIVQRLPDPASAAVVKAVVEITHAYGGQVLAECVETRDQADAARDLGVDLGQGWFFGRPVARDAGSAQVATPTVVSTVVAAAVTAPRASAAPAADDVRAAVHHGDDAAVGLVPGDDLPASLDVHELMGRAVAVSSVGITISDARVPGMPLVYVNEAFEQITGWTAAQVLGSSARLLQGPLTDPAEILAMSRALGAGRDHVALLRNYCSDGRTWWNELRLSPVRDEARVLTHYLGFQTDVTARVEAERRVAHLAFHDQLTGLPNRSRLRDTLGDQIALADAAGEHLALLFVDLDEFKAANDRFGHAVGDGVLAAAAARLRGAVAAEHVVGRWGGDEFLIVTAGSSPDRAHAAAQRVAADVVETFREPLLVAEGEAADASVVLGASVGVAMFPQHGRDPDSLLRAADDALYAAKDAGRRRFAVAPAAPAPVPSQCTAQPA